MKRCRFSFTEQIIWTEPLRGTIPLTEKEIADNLAIGGPRNTADSVGRLHVVKEFGAKLGASLIQLINKNTEEHRTSKTVDKSWVSITCKAIGSTDDTCGPPDSAIAAVKSIIAEFSNLSKHDVQQHSARYSPRSKVDAQLLEAWRAAAGDPDS